MPDLHDAFSALAHRHRATDAVGVTVARRAAVRRRRRTAVATATVTLVLVLAVGTALALRPTGTSDLDVAGTAPAPTDLPAPTDPPATTTTFAPDDLRSVLPSASHPVHVQVGGLAIVRGEGPVELCTGPMDLPRPPSCRGAPLANVTVDDLRSAITVDETTANGELVVWGTASVRGWFDGATITLDGPMQSWAEGPLSGSTFTAGGPATTSSAEQQMAVMDDLVTAGLTDWGSVAGGGPGQGLAILVPWADQALADLLAARHPGFVITLTGAMVPI